MNNSNKGYRVIFSGILEAQLPDAAKWHNFHVFREGDVSNSWSLYSLAPLWTWTLQFESILYGLFKNIVVANMASE